HMMAVWWQALVLLCCALNCVVPTTPPQALLKNKCNNSFRLARSTRTHVQQLQRKYKEQQLGNKDFEDRSRQLKDLPLLSTDFYSWLSLTDWERLHAAFWDIQTYRDMLEWKRQQLEEEQKKQMGGHAALNTLPRSIKHIQLDLRDLMNQISSQPTIPPVNVPPNRKTSSKILWDSRVEGYIILRDLDFYLIKLARDFLLLASKTWTTQQ
uniref:Uncharacterized protein n=1 Tax=Mola mola TaxID=94237 RepID=A0A3Q4BM28_MOLML